MKKAIVKKLQAVADTLPDVMEMKPYQTTGAELIKEGTHRDRKGRPIKKGQIYFGERMQKVDHLTKLKAVYQKGGDAAVSTYTVNAVKKNSEQNKQKAPVVNTI